MSTTLSQQTQPHIHTGCSEIVRVDRAMVRGQQKPQESGADVGTVVGKETDRLLEVAVVAGSSGKALGDGI